MNQDIVCTCHHLTSEAMGSNSTLGHSVIVVTHPLPTTEVSGSNPGLYVLTNGRQFTVQNLDQLYVLVSSARITTRRDMTCTVLKAT